MCVVWVSPRDTISWTSWDGPSTSSSLVGVHLWTGLKVLHKKQERKRQQLCPFRGVGLGMGGNAVCGTQLLQHSYRPSFVPLSRNLELVRWFLHTWLSHAMASCQMHSIATFHLAHLPMRAWPLACVPARCRQARLTCPS